MAIRSFDNWAEPFRLKDALGLRHPPAGTAEEVKQLRVAGVNHMLLVDGRVYMPPGRGLTTAATPTLVSLKCNRVRQLATVIGDVFVRPTGEAMESVAKKGVVNALFSLEVLAQGKLAVSCREAGLTWPFPSPPIVDDARSELEHWFAPRWAVTKLIQQADSDSYPQ